MMNETLCTYDGRREDVLVAYLYDDIEPLERAAFERHLPGCLPCRTELRALSDVRDGLMAWAAPDVAEGVGGQTPRAALRLADTPAKASGWRVLGEAPVWIQAAAAMLVVAASLGIANLRLNYSRDGLSVSTGWMQQAPTAAVPEVASAQVIAPQPPEAAPWRADMTALEQRVLQELKAQPVASDGAAGDEALLVRVRALIQESERRQQRELALRVAEVARDAQTQRQADLVRIDRSLGLMQSRTGVEVMRTQQQLNSLAQRVSQRQ
jgi:hypothetical protein